jgi:hypothetical protein
MKKLREIQTESSQFYGHNLSSLFKRNKGIFLYLVMNLNIYESGLY